MSQQRQQRPSQDQPPSPSPSEAPASSDASAKGSAPASPTDGAGVFIGDAGPAFDPGSAPAAEPAPAPPLIEAPGWEEDTVRSILTAQGAVVHTLAGVAEDDWLYLEHELGAIAPPLTRILNRYDALRAAAGTGDEMALLIGLSGYVSRSYMTRRAELAVAADLEPEPITGVRAPAGTSGDQDPVQRAARGEDPAWNTEAR